MTMGVLRPLRRPVRRSPFVRLRLTLLGLLAVLGPGVVSGFADNDAGGITTYSVVGAQFGYDLLWVVLASMLALYVTQEIGARLGLASGQGLLALIRENYGVRWATFAIVAMLIANLGDTVGRVRGHRGSPLSVWRAHPPELRCVGARGRRPAGARQRRARAVGLRGRGHRRFAGLCALGRAGAP